MTDSPPVTMEDQLLALLSVAQGPLCGAIGLLYQCTALVYGRRWYYAPTRPLAELTCGASLLAETSVTAYLGKFWHLSFWLYRVLLLAAVITVTYGVVVSYYRGGTLSNAVSGLLLRSTLKRQQAAGARP